MNPEKPSLQESQEMSEAKYETRIKTEESTSTLEPIDTHTIQELDKSKIADLRKRLEVSGYAYKDPERLLDPNYNLNEVPKGERKRQLLGMKDYYNTIRANIDSKPATALSPQEKKIAKSISDLPIDDEEKTALILVWRRLKPSATLHIDSLEGVVSTFLAKRKVKKVEEALDQIGIGFTKFFYKEYSSWALEVSPDKDTLNILKSESERFAKHLEDRKNNPNAKYKFDYEKAGIAYGYPETAIRMFVEEHLDEKSQKEKRNRMQQEHLPKDIPKPFIYSKNNWEEEVKTSIRWAQEIALIDPDLFERSYLKTSKVTP